MKPICLERNVLLAAVEFVGAPGGFIFTTVRQRHFIGKLATQIAAVVVEHGDKLSVGPEVCVLIDKECQLFGYFASVNSDCIAIEKCRILHWPKQDILCARSILNM